jgi:sugar phosphate isomerase/epimerase
VRVVVISDEISDDFEEAVHLGAMLHVDAYELRWLRLPRSVVRRRVCDLDDEQAAALAEFAAHEQVTITSLSPGIRISPCNGAAASQAQAQRLARSFRLAEVLGTRDIVIQGFVPPERPRNGVCPAEVIDLLGEAAHSAETAGLRLLLRNTPDSFADTGAHTASIVHAVHSPALAVSWDPCHATRAGEAAICEGYEWVAPFVHDVRVKDQMLCAGLGYEYAVLAQGCMDWPAQLQALARDGYRGTITVGAQLEPRLLSTMHSLEALRTMLGGLGQAGPSRHGVPGNGRGEKA